MQGKDNIFDTDLFAPVMAKINEFSSSDDIRAKRIIADHIRTAIFMINDGVTPSNSDRGYILRRLIRRAVRYADLLGIGKGDVGLLVQSITDVYLNIYIKNSGEAEYPYQVILEEEDRFRKTLNQGMKEFEKLSYNISSIGNVPIENIKSRNALPISKIKSISGVPLRKVMSGKDAFSLFSTYGFPVEMTIELMKERGLSVDVEGFKSEFKKHQELSRAGAQQKFKGGLASHDEQSVKYHTATHLLHKALREVLGGEVFQKGSNITPERLRFDFSFGRKMTDEEKRKVEDLVNEKITDALPVTYEDLPIEEAEKRGAIGLFEEKYGDTVRVYKIGEFSLELCGGPHVKNTNELGTFKIAKEEAVSAGVRRIKAILR